LSTNPHHSNHVLAAPWASAKALDRTLQETASGSQQAEMVLQEEEVDVQGAQEEYRVQLQAVSTQLQVWREPCRSAAVACRTSSCLRPLRLLLDQEEDHQREVVVMLVVVELSAGQVELDSNNSRDSQITELRITRRLHWDSGQAGNRLDKYHRHNNNHKAVADEMVVEPTVEHRHRHKHRAGREREHRQQNQMDQEESRTRRARPT
jgi:hypothetical protein